MVVVATDAWLCGCQATALIHNSLACGRPGPRRCFSYMNAVQLGVSAGKALGDIQAGHNEHAGNSDTVGLAEIH